MREKFLLLVPVEFALGRDGEYLVNEDGDQEDDPGDNSSRCNGGAVVDGGLMDELTHVCCD